MVTPCGVNCSECVDFKKSCDGCRSISGKIYWAEFIGSDICPIYNCCTNQKGYEHCGHCEKIPCQIYYDTQDPSTTDEEHKEGIIQRVNLLREMMGKHN